MLLLLRKIDWGGAGQIPEALSQDRCGSFLPINRYFFLCFGSFAAVWVEFDLTSKADMSDERQGNSLHQTSARGRQSCGQALSAAFLTRVLALDRVTGGLAFTSLRSACRRRNGQPSGQTATIFQKFIGASERRPRKAYRLGDLSIHARELTPRCADQPNSRALSLAAFSARAANWRDVIGCRFIIVAKSTYQPEAPVRLCELHSIASARHCYDEPAQSFTHLNFKFTLL